MSKMSAAHNRIDLIGQVFNHLTVLAYSHTALKHAYWRCLCACAKHTTVDSGHIKSGKIKSCGCRQGRGVVHGESGRRKRKGVKRKPTTEYSTWAGMKRRCHANTPSNKDWQDYGGRGIKVCDRWLDPAYGYQNFLADMGRKSSPEHSLERDDVNGDYCPENCRWADAKTQVDNRRATINEHNYKDAYKRSRERVQMDFLKMLAGVAK